MAYPLSGIRVVEVRSGIAVACAGMLLRDVGAEVVKVEPPQGDATRPLPGSRVWNRGKRSVVLDESDPRFLQLLESADVVVVGGSGRPDWQWRPGEGQIVCYAPPYADVDPYRRLPESLFDSLCFLYAVLLRRRQLAAVVEPR